MKNEFRQVVRLATPGELRAYIVYEHQLDVDKTRLIIHFSSYRRSL
jgi:hypothetical protein